MISSTPTEELLRQLSPKHVDCYIVLALGDFAKGAPLGWQHAGTFGAVVPTAQAALALLNQGVKGIMIFSYGWRGGVQLIESSLPEPGQHVLSMKDVFDACFKGVQAFYRWTTGEEKALGFTAVGADLVAGETLQALYVDERSV